MRTGKTSTLILALVVAIALLIIVPAIIYWRSQTRIPTVNLPTPNAYELLVQAGSQDETRRRPRPIGTWST